MTADPMPDRDVAIIRRERNVSSTGTERGVGRESSPKRSDDAVKWQVERLLFRVVSRNRDLSAQGAVRSVRPQRQRNLVFLTRRYRFHGRTHVAARTGNSRNFHRPRARVNQSYDTQG